MVLDIPYKYVSATSRSYDQAPEGNNVASQVYSETIRTSLVITRRYLYFERTGPLVSFSSYKNSTSVTQFI